jgi:hypothetical protein
MRTKLAIAFAALFVCAVAAYADDAAPQMTPEQQAMMAKMMKAATPGPQHAMLAKLAGDWTCSIKYQMDPKQPAQDAQSTSSITTLMDGRYIQETSSGQMMGAPFNGMGLYGYDNVSGKFVSTWIDNMGTGIMSAVGSADASGKVINWVGTMNDPVTARRPRSAW